jgi:hypothetical protein
MPVRFDRVNVRACGLTLVAASLLTGLGCGGGSSSPEASGGASSAGATAAGGASPVAGGGASPAGAANSAGAPSTNSGGMAGAGGSVAGVGNTGGDASGGAGTAGSAGSAGSAGTSGSQAGGSTADDKAAAQVLDGYAIVKPCVSSFKPTMTHPKGDCCCEEEAVNENQHISKQFGGDPNVTYNVKVRIAGIAERYWYEGGTLDPVSKLFYSGGLPTIHSTAAPNKNLSPGKGACKIHPPETDGSFKLPFAVPTEINPSDGCFNGFNIFALTVSEPKKSYYLNYTTDYDNVDRQPHQVYKNDYTVTFPIKGQAKLDFYTIDGDHHEVTNDGTLTVPNVKTAQPYNGNFLEFTVLEVTRAN